MSSSDVICRHILISELLLSQRASVHIDALVLSRCRDWRKWVTLGTGRPTAVLHHMLTPQDAVSLFTGFIKSCCTGRLSVFCLEICIEVLSKI